jgi:PAS domain-containing protein
MTRVMSGNRRREAELDREIEMFRAASDPTREEERAAVAELRVGRRAAEEQREAALRAHQGRVDAYHAYGPAMRPPPEGPFRIEFTERGGRVLTEHADEYREALRKVRDGLLGTSGDAARVFFDGRLVAMAGLERAEVRGRGGRFVVRFAPGGEKPRKR